MRRREEDRHTSVGARTYHLEVITLAQRVSAFLNASPCPVASDQELYPANVMGKRLVDVDPWAYACFMQQLRTCVMYPENVSRPELVEKFLADLPSALVTRKCGCGNLGCHTYSFSHDVPYASEVETFAFATSAKWQSFFIGYSSDGTLLGVEILCDDESPCNE